ncbi:6-carboxyhexanoate--CoA ligase [Bacillaceae bacterium]
MSNGPLYSVRMRAAQGGAHEEGGRHISGGERLGRAEELERLAAELVRKALTHSRGTPDFINVTIEALPADAVQRLVPLPVSTIAVTSVEEGRERAAALLREAGVSEKAVRRGLELLKCSVNLRGAAILDARTGERLDGRGLKGVRVSRMDWDRDGYAQWLRDHPHLSSPRVAEALALATKVASAPGTVAELCWSDDPEYVTGYVASRGSGYVRVTRLKHAGDLSGGRVFFAHGDVNLAEYIRYLERQPVWIG